LTWQERGRMVENVCIESRYGTADSPGLTFFHLRPTRVLLSMEPSL
jgi:hypothetical protein